MRGDEQCAKAAGARTVYQLPVERIASPRERARRRFAPEETRALADSIARCGLLSPIIVRERADGYEVVAGERRLQAVKLLGEKHIDALVVRADGAQAAVLSLIENLQRKNLHFFEEAEALERLMARHGFTQQALAACLGISQPAISNKLRLLALASAVREAIEKGGLTERHARALLLADGDETRLALALRAAGDKLSVRELEKLARDARSSRVKPGGYKLYPRDQRLLINAVLRAVKSLNLAGVRATSRVERREACLEVVVTLPIAPNR